MDRSEISQKVEDVIVDVLGVSPDEVGEDSAFDDFDADSLDKLQLVTAFEDEFGLEIPDDQLESINSVADAVDVIEAAR